MKRFVSLSICLLMVVLPKLDATTIYVAPDGTPANDGTSFESPLNFSTALSQVTAGDTILLESGTYSIPYVAEQKNTINFTKSGSENSLIYVIGTGGIATFDFSFPELIWVQDSYGFYVTGNYWYFKNLAITRAGYQGSYVTGSHNTFENCAFYRNRNTGLEINKGGSYTTVINCDAYKNYDPKKSGSMADGIAPKQTMGPGNKLIGCRVWENSDDGYDCYDSPEIVTFEDCWAFRNGVNTMGYENFDGNANGFKVGGNSQEANHVLTNCVAFDHPGKGFDQNNNAGGITLYNCTSFRNGRNYGMGNSLNSGQTHIIKNNISLQGESSDDIRNAIEEFNSWDAGFSVSNDDFISLDTSFATIARNEDGSLPNTDLFQLAETSLLVDAGTDVGLSYEGNAPDLGCFESPFTRDPSGICKLYSNDGLHIYPIPASNVINIQFDLISRSNVSVSLIDMAGQVRQLNNSENYSSGNHILSFDCSNMLDGIYVLRMDIEDQVYYQRIAIKN